MKKQILSLITAAVCIASVHIPATRAAGVDNIAARADYLYNITWTAKANVKGWRDTVYLKGHTYHIPYGQPVAQGKYICWDVSVDDFLTSANSASSRFYTSKSYNGYSADSYSAYYAMDCSAFASYCWDLSGRATTSGWSSLPVTNKGKCTAANVGNIHIGDALNLAGNHIVIVSDITYDSKGIVTRFEITEQTVPQIKRTYYTPYELAEKYGDYTIYRYNYRDSVSPPPAENAKPRFDVEESADSVRITNNGDKQKAVVIIAEYTDNLILKDVVKNDVAFAAGETREFPLKGEIHKIFIWSSLVGMIPLA